jgi:hypothetical protein
VLRTGFATAPWIEYDFLVIHPVNPHTVAKYRQAFAPSRAKADSTDAKIGVAEWRYDFAGFWTKPQGFQRLFHSQIQQHLFSFYSGHVSFAHNLVALWDKGWVTASLNLIMRRSLLIAQLVIQPI